MKETAKLLWGHPSRTGIVLAAAFLAAVWALWPRAATVEGAAVPGAPIASAPAPAPGAAQVDTVPQLPPGAADDGADLRLLLAPSLRGTDMDGQIDTGTGGHLVVSVALRRLFEYFLAASGEVSDAAIEARIAAVINHSVHDPAASEARDVLRRYLAWRRYAGTTATPDSSLHSGLPERFAELQASRRRFFSRREADALWGEEERATEAALRRQEIASDSGLDAVTRARKLAEADGLRSPTARAQEAAATRVLRQMDDEALQRQTGATADALQEARVQSVGPAAAARLAAMDAERNQWQARVEDFLQARHAILANPALSANEQAQAVEVLRAQRFEGPEQLRVRTLEIPETSETPETSEAP